MNHRFTKTVLPLTTIEFKQLSTLLHDQCGLYLQEDQAYLVETRLREFVQELGLQSYGELYSCIRNEPEKLLPSVINLMTTNETLWFRDDSCWNALEKAIVPPLLKKIENDRSSRIKIWIAGCSTGQEAYSLAILIDELCRRRYKPELARSFDIHAMDISQAALHIARTACYNTFELNRGLSALRREHYFEQQEEHYWVVRPNIRLRVQFEAINLTQNFTHLGMFHLILCRNVTIYFTRTIRDHILSNMATMLEPGGVLMLGATEPLWSKKSRFKVKEFEGCVYIQP